MTRFKNGDIVWIKNQKAINEAFDNADLTFHEWLATAADADVCYEMVELRLDEQTGEAWGDRETDIGRANTFINPATRTATFMDEKMFERNMITRHATAAEIAVYRNLLADAEAGRSTVTVVEDWNDRR
jgi:hypothetical protein